MTLLEAVGLELAIVLAGSKKEEIEAKSKSYKEKYVQMRKNLPLLVGWLAHQNLAKTGGVK